VQPPVIGVLNSLEADQFADAVHVSLDDVTSEPAIGLHGKFEVDQSTFLNARERGARPGFGCKIGTEGTRLDIEGGEADSAYRDAVTSAQFCRRMFRGDGDATVLAALLDAGNAADFLDYACEHGGPPGERFILSYEG
jgi:hypothetical protein